MELQDVEYIYKGAIKDLKDNAKKVEAMKKEIETLDDKIILNRADAIKAKTQSQMSGITDAEKANYIKEMDEKNKLADELLALVGTRRKDLEKLQAEVEILQKKIDGVIAEVSQDPEVAQLVKENVEAKRQQKAKTKDMKKKAETRENKDKEKKELETRKSKLDKIMEIVNKDPKAKKALIDFIKLRKRKNDLEEELKTCKDDSRKVKIYEELRDMEQKELPVAKGKFLEYFGKEKTGITLSWSDIDDIINNGLTLDKKGNIDLKSTVKTYSKNLDKRIEDRTKEIAVLDKEIAPYRDLLGIQSQPQGQQHEDNAPEAGDNEGHEQGDEGSDSGREEKPSLFQRVKNWFKMTPEERKAQRESRREERRAKKEQKLLNAGEEEKQNPVEISKERKEMLNKYKVVQTIEKAAWDKMVADAQQTVQPSNDEREQ